MTILSLIKDVLVLHDRIDIPGIGCFTVEPQPAVLNETEGLLNPPSRKIQFSSEVKSNTPSLLTEYIANTYGLPVIKAEREIQLSLKAIQSALDKGEKITIDGIGILQRNAAGVIVFEQVMETWVNLESLGYQTLRLPVFPKTPVYADPTDAAPLSSPYTEVRTSKHFTPESKKNSKKNRSPVIVTGILLGLLVGTGVLIMLLRKEEPTAVPVPVKPAYTGSEAWEDTLNLTKSEHQYFLVTGSFRKEKNAKEYAHQLSEQGYNAHIISDSALFRVVIGTYFNRNEAVNELNNLRTKKGNDFVWLLTH